MEVAMDWQPDENGVDGIHPPLLVPERDRTPPRFRMNGGGRNGRVEGVGGGDGVGAGVIGDEQPEQAAGAYIDCFADFRILSQTVLLSCIDFSRHSFTVYTEMEIMPLDPNLASVFLNIGRNVRLPNEVDGSEGRVTINDVEARYEKLEVFDGVSRTCREKSMRELKKIREERIKTHDGELRIQIPAEVLPCVRRLSCLKVCLEVYVEKAVHGVQFNGGISPDGTLDRGAHIFTFRSDLMSSTREWLPCLDSPDQLCLWNLHFCVDSSLTVVAAGELLEVEFVSEEAKEKVFHYQQLVPTAATNMGWAIGNFTPHIHTDMPELTSFSLPGLSALVRHTVQNLDRTFEYFEELLSCRYPYASYKQVFVDNLPEEMTCYSSFTLFSVTVLYHKKIIDVVQEVRQILAFAVARQFFGCFISPADFVDLWVVQSLSRFLASLYISKVFGYSEYLYHLKKILNEVCDYESQWGVLVLRSWSSWDDRPIWPGSSLSCSSLYAETLFKKGELVIRMLQKRLGKEPFFQVLHKIVGVGEQMRGKRQQPQCWIYLVLSTDAFFRTVTSVTGNEIPTFLDQWVYQGGHASFHVNYTFNRKRNMIELDIQQDTAGRNGRTSYVGPLTVIVQELDGSFTHTLQIDADSSRHELQCHSKGRRQKKKKVPLSSGEEVDVDLSLMDPESPVLWIRVDPELLLLRAVHLRQPSYQWEYMLKYERDCLAQLAALDRIEHFPSAASRAVLIEAMQTEHFFYRVRCRAAFSLVAVQNKMAEVVAGRPPLLAFFTEKFGCKSAPHLPRSNNFVATSANLQMYFLMQAIPQAVGRARSSSAASMSEVHSFLLDLLYYNDNSTNRYSDDHYRASLLTALASTVQAGETLDGNPSTNPTSLSGEISLTLKELTLSLNMDCLRPSYHCVVGSAALLGIYQLQKFGHLPHNSTLFWKFAQPSIFVSLRKTSLWILVDRLQVVRGVSPDELTRLIRMSFDDPDPGIRRHIPLILVKHPPFHACNPSDTSKQLNTSQLAEYIWAIITAPSTEARQRALFTDVWFSLYGWTVPVCLGGPPLAPPLRPATTEDGMEPAAAPPSLPPGLRVPPPPPSGDSFHPPSPLCTWHSADACKEPPSSPSASRFEESQDDRLQ